MAGRAEVRASVRVDRPAEEVFDYLVDVTKHGEWSPRPLRVESLAEPVAVGTTFTSYGVLPPKDKNHRNDVTVTAVDRPTRFAFTATEKGEQFVNTFTLTPDGTGTTVERLLDAPKPGGLLGLVFPLIVSGVIRPDIAKGLRNLKAKVEAR